MRVLNYIEFADISFYMPWLNLLEEVRGSGIEQFLLCRAGGNLEQTYEKIGIQTFTAKSMMRNFPPLNMKYFSLLRKIQPDIVHTRLNAAAKIAGYWGQRLNIPTVSTIDFVSEKIHCYEKVDYVLACSKWIRDHFVDLGLPEDKIEVFYNSVDAKRYIRDEVIRRAFRREHGISDDERVFVAAGRFIDGKGFDLLIQAFARVLSQRRDVRLLLAGDGPERATYISLAESLGVMDKVIFSDGFVTDVRPWLWGGDYFVMPSMIEAFGLVTLEALAAELTVIAFGVRGNAEIVRDGENGFLAADCTVEALAKRMTDVLELDEQALGAIKETGQSGLRAFSNEVLAARLLEIYAMALDKKKGCAGAQTSG